MTGSEGQPWTILRVLRWATDFLAAKGISEARAAAEVLLAHCLQLSRLQLYLQYDRPLQPAELACYKQLLKRRLAREPTQYITGHQEFWSLDFLVSPAALIPRPETEILVEAVLRFLKQSAADRPLVVDVGTGCGVIPVVLAKELPDGRFLGIDCSWEALELARTNARRHGVADRLLLIQGDLLAPFRPARRFAALAANLPYIPTAVWEQLPPEIRVYEPRLALDGGPDGLRVIRRLVAQAPAYLQPGGLLALEIGHDQSAAVSRLVEQTQAFDPPEILRDYQRWPRVVLARRRP